MRLLAVAALLIAGAGADRLVASRAHGHHRAVAQIHKAAVASASTAFEGVDGALSVVGATNDSCGPRSELQRTIDDVYSQQRQALDAAAAALTDAELDSFTVLEAWRVWELYPPIYTCPSKQKLGRQPKDGGKFVCGVKSLLQRPNCTILSFGSDGEASFEADVLARTSCTVHVCDPTLDAARQRSLKGMAPAAIAHELGLGAADGPAQLGGRAVELRTLPTILRELGLSHVDLLKVDVETAEWGVLEQLLTHYANASLPFTQLQIELHYMGQGARVPGHARRVLSILQGLEAAGLRVFSFEHNFEVGKWAPGYIEYSLVNVKDCHTRV